MIISNTYDTSKRNKIDESFATAVDINYEGGVSAFYNALRPYFDNSIEFFCQCLSKKILVIIHCWDKPFLEAD